MPSLPVDPLTVRRRLLTWFRKHARPLPWRETRDPYAIWISEVMLQQTQVATVIAYFQRFLKQYPTLKDLGQADEQAVLSLWEGLGYYRRARDLWRAAQQLRAHNFTTIPNDIELVLGLPGFGRYTANAVLSQAYDRPLPILEANSTRVLCRLFAIDDDPKASAVQKRLWNLAENLVPSRSAGDFNQAMMELGSLVCTPATPSCSVCPLARQCHAHSQQRQKEIPRRAKAAAVVAIAEVAAVIRKRGKLLIVQRPDTGRWAKMWEFPHHALEKNETHMEAVARLLRQLTIEGDVTGEIAAIRHSVTRFRIALTCVGVEHRRGNVAAERHANFAWVKPGDLHAYPLSAPQRRLAKRLLEVRW